MPALSQEEDLRQESKEEDVVIAESFISQKRGGIKGNSKERKWEYTVAQFGTSIILIFKIPTLYPFF